ncbi:MAG: Uma2 family endonuclease [Scytolyngbya sp. HA4215-MV1]|nr:Uma2 family endonuclease [Scytolyngbya sp. HA4215-MV1]
MTAYTINFEPIVSVTDEFFEQLCQANPDVKFERTAKGALVLVAPTGGETGFYNFEIAVDFGIWNRRAKLGICFDSSTCFKLPNGALRSPDVAWVQKGRWDALTPEQRAKFPLIAPDVVLELLSPSDEIEDVRVKMNEYRDNGVRLGWLIDRKTRKVEVYRPGQDVEVLDSPTTLSDSAVLPDFVLNCNTLW